MISILDIPPGETAIMIAGGNLGRVIQDIETVLNMKQHSIIRANRNLGVLELSTGGKIKLISPDQHTKLWGLDPRTVFVFRDTVKMGEQSAHISEVLAGMREKGFKIQTFDEEWWPIERALRRKHKERLRKERE